MPQIDFVFGDSSKTVDLKDVNSVNDVASNMKEVIKENKRQSQRITSEENWRAGYDVLTEGALGDYPEDCGW
tara:strand:+ start:731 stop:946 length:216 start_codon:yes stop_codon:yes gene_type:complete